MRRWNACFISKFRTWIVPLKFVLPYGELVKFYLPTKHMLFWKRIYPDINYPRCQLSDEDVNHVFRHCFYANKVWLALGFTVQPHNSQMGFHEWLSWLFDSHHNSRHKELAITIWALWSARNKLLHENEITGVGNLITMIRGYCGELNSFATNVYRDGRLGRVV